MDFHELLETVSAPDPFSRISSSMILASSQNLLISNLFLANNLFNAESIFLHQITRSFSEENFRIWSQNEVG